jgi:thymidylate synthase (FAD)
MKLLEFNNYLMRYKMINYRSDLKLKVYQQCGCDEDIILAALADEEFSVKDEARFFINPGAEEARYKFLNFMMKNRHGTPYEKGYLNCFFEGPIFILRQWHRHRIGWSYSEQSARWEVARPDFYIATPDIPMKRVVDSKKTAPQFVLLSEQEYNQYIVDQKRAYEVQWDSYQSQLQAGIDKEHARTVLGVGLYTKQYATCNPRSLMAFLSLRKHEPTAFYKSYPQWQIDYIARRYDEIFKQYWPLTHRSFCENGFVAP